MKTASAAKVAAQFEDYLDASQQQPVLVTRNGKPVAVLMAVRNKRDAEQLAASPRRSLRSVFKQAHDQLEQGGGISHDEFWKRMAESRSTTPKPGSRSRRGD